MSKQPLSLLLLALCWALASPGISHGENSRTPEQTWQRLEEISTELSIANARLRRALNDSQTSLRELERLYETAERQLTDYESELKSLDRSLQTAESRLTRSEAHSGRLQRRLSASMNSLESLQTSLDEVERALHRARLERWLWGLAGIGIGAAGGFVGGILQ